MSGKRICVGAIAGAHGVAGAFKVKAFTANPFDIAAYGPVTSEDGALTLDLTVRGGGKNAIVIAAAPQVKDRTGAEALKGVRLYASRASLPAVGYDEFYVDDLIGLKARATDGRDLGRIVAVHNFGAGDILEIRPIAADARPVLLPFIREAAPSVDIAGGVISIDAEFYDGAIAPATPDISTETGEIVSDDRNVNLDAMREEDA